MMLGMAIHAYGQPPEFEPQLTTFRLSSSTLRRRELQELIIAATAELAVCAEASDDCTAYCMHVPPENTVSLASHEPGLSNSRNLLTSLQLVREDVRPPTRSGGQWQPDFLRLSLRKNSPFTRDATATAPQAEPSEGEKTDSGSAPAEGDTPAPAEFVKWRRYVNLGNEAVCLHSLRPEHSR